MNKIQYLISSLSPCDQENESYLNNSDIGMLNFLARCKSPRNSHVDCRVKVEMAAIWKSYYDEIMNSHFCHNFNFCICKHLEPHSNITSTGCGTIKELLN